MNRCRKKATIRSKNTKKYIWSVCAHGIPPTPFANQLTERSIVTPKCKINNNNENDESKYRVALFSFSIWKTATGSSFFGFSKNPENEIPYL